MAIFQGLRYFWPADFSLEFGKDGGVTLGCLIALCFFVIPPFIVGRFSGRYACVAAVAYSGTLSLTVIACRIVVERNWFTSGQAPMDFAVCFGCLVAFSTPISMFGAVSRYLAEKWRRRNEADDAPPDQHAIQIFRSASFRQQHCVDSFDASDLA
jgi:hypothetical protein